LTERIILRRAASFSAFVLGFSAMSAQIIFMREFLIAFCGNEIAIGLILMNWLVAGGIGSLFLGSLSDKIRERGSLLALCQIILSAALVIGLTFIRQARIILHLTPGALVPISQMAAASFLILAPACIILGFIFSLTSRIYAQENESVSAGVGKVYFFEALGSSLGGLLVSLFFIRYLDSFQITGIIVLLNILAAFFIALVYAKSEQRLFILAFSGSVFFCVISMYSAGGWDYLNRQSLKKQWQGYNLIDSRNSIYGNVAVVKREGQVSFFDNGLRLHSVPDTQPAEEAAHFPLLEHPAPQDILLIGGGTGGLIKEILKEPLRRVDYVELDPLIIEMAKKYLAYRDYLPLRDPRVLIHSGDGRLFVRSKSAKYDCVIIHIGSPSSAQLNRYYTVEFFREIKAILKDGGIVSFAIGSSENYMNRQLRDFLRCLYVSLKSVFSDVLVIPGDTAYFIACNKKGVLTYDYKILAQRVRQRGMELKYVREYYLSSRLSPQRIAYMENALKAGSIKINYDFFPSAYFYNIIFWASYFRDSYFARTFEFFNNANSRKAVFPIFSIFFLTGLTCLFLRRNRQRLMLAAVATSGFSQIAFQVIILFSFQAIYGYLFYKLGIILASFMLGLAAGAYAFIKIIPENKKNMRQLIWIETAISLYALSLPLIFFWLAGAGINYAFGLGANAIFPLLSAIAGFTGALAFLMANKIYVSGNETAAFGRLSGVSYGIDLLGSSLGAILLSLFLIPIFGIPLTCVLLAFLNFLVLILVSLFEIFNGAQDGNSGD